MKKLMRSAITLAFACLLIIPTISFSQERNKADWVATFGKSVLWQRTTSFGMIVVCTGEGLHGVDPESGKILWTRSELANIPESGYQPIEGSPFVQLSGAGTSPIIYVLEPFEGTLIFNSKDAGIQQVREFHVLPRNLSILVQGQDPAKKSPSLYMIDLATGKKMWEKHDEFGMLTAFRELGGDQFLLATLWKMYKINSKTGVVEWEQPLDPQAAAQMEKLKGLGSMLKNLAETSIQPGDVLADFYLLRDGSNFIIGYQAKSTSEKTDASGKKVTTISYKSGYQCVELATGKPVWAEGVEFAGMKGKLIFDERGLIVCPDAGSNTMINMVDYKSGAKMWGKNMKGIKVKGGVADYVYTKAGILLVLAKESSSSGDQNFMMNMLDPASGALKFENYAKLKGTIQRTELLGGGLFFVTDEEADVLNLASGETMFDKTIRTGSNMNISGENKIYVYSPKDKLLYAIDKTSLFKEVFSKTEIKFEGKEDPTGLELRENGILIMGMQNIVMVGSDGSVKFQKYYPAPDISGIMKALNAAMAVRAAYIGFAAGVTSAALGAATAQYADSPVEKEIGAGLTQAYGNLSAAGFSYAGKYVKAINQRFKATAIAPDFIFMMTEGDDRKDNRLIRVSKSTGQVMDYVSLGKDKDPSYEIDNIANQIYYRKEPTKLFCFKFNL